MQGSQTYRGLAAQIPTAVPDNDGVAVKVYVAGATDIAHERRTPVSNLMTQTQLSTGTRALRRRVPGILESNAEEFEHMAGMITDMLLLGMAWWCRTGKLLTNL